MSLICPKCTSEMRSYERNLVTVDQCTGCGGLFLDRGELERLAAAESQWHATPAAPAAAPAPVQQTRYDEPRYDDRHRQDTRGGYQQQPYRKKKKSFLSELFDD